MVDGVGERIEDGQLMVMKRIQAALVLLLLILLLLLTTTTTAAMPLVFTDPPISTGTAHLLTTLFAFCYVGSIYLSKTARLTFSSDATHTPEGTPREKLPNERWRNDPDVIRARLISTSIATLVCCVVIFVMLWMVAGDVDDNVRLIFLFTLSPFQYAVPDVRSYS
jgi:hypothetical protein